VQSESLSWSGSKFQIAGPATENGMEKDSREKWLMPVHLEKKQPLYGSSGNSAGIHMDRNENVKVDDIMPVYRFSSVQDPHT